MKTVSLKTTIATLAIATLMGASAMATDLNCEVKISTPDGDQNSVVFSKSIVDGKAQLDLGVTDAGYQLNVIYLDLAPQFPNLISVGAKNKDLAFGTQSSDSATFKIGGRHISNTYEVECSVGNN